MKVKDIKTSKGITGGVLILLIGLVAFTTALAGSITGFSIFSSTNQDNQLTGQQINKIAPGCTTSAQCPPTQYCGVSNSYGGARCFPKRTNGLSCTASDQCSSNVCNNGRCASPPPPTTTSPPYSPQPVCVTKKTENLNPVELNDTPIQLCARTIDSQGNPYKLVNIYVDSFKRAYASTDLSCRVSQGVIESGAEILLPTNIYSSLTAQFPAQPIASIPLSNAFQTSSCRSMLGGNFAEPLAGDHTTSTNIRSILCCKAE